jgi:hypothetical protein
LIRQNAQKKTEETRKKVVKKYPYLIMDLFREKHILGTNQGKQVFISLRYTLGLLEHFDFL